MIIVTRRTDRTGQEGLVGGCIGWMVRLVGWVYPLGDGWIGGIGWVLYFCLYLSRTYLNLPYA